MVEAIFFVLKDTAAFLFDEILRAGTPAELFSILTTGIERGEETSTVGAGEDATAVSYVQLRVGSDRTVYGVGRDANIVTASLKAVISAVNRA